MLSAVVEFFSEGLGLRIRNLLLFPVAVWAGSLIAGGAGLVMDLADSHGAKVELEYLTHSLLLVLAGLPPFNLLFLVILLSRLLVYPESTGIFTWAALVIGESLFCMLGLMFVVFDDHYSDGAIAAAWGTWLLLAGVAGVAFRFLYHWHLNRWAAELFALQAENAVARAEMEAEAAEEERARAAEEAGQEAAAERDGRAARP